MTSEDSDSKGGGDNWRDTMHPPRLWFMNAYSLAAVIPFFAYWSVFTLSLAIGGLIFFWLCQRKGYEPIEAMKAMRTYLIGDVRPCLPPSRKRYWK